MTEQDDRARDATPHLEPVPVTPDAPTASETRPWQPAAPTATESLVVLGVMAIASVCAWLLYAPMIRAMLLALRRYWLNH